MKKILILIALCLATAAGAETPNPLTEIRYCGPVKRDAKGEIVRSPSVLAAFKKVHPCPATGSTTGACPGWQMNHVIPLANGGCDAVWNLDWMPTQIKTCAQPYCRDRFERKIYAVPMQPVQVK